MVIRVGSAAAGPSSTTRASRSASTSRSSAATHRFRVRQDVGVSPVLFYDPVGRVVATLHPNHTWEKVLFDPWRQETWDVNDTVLMADPKTDPDVAEFFSGCPMRTICRPGTRSAQGGSARPAEQERRRKAADPRRHTDRRPCRHAWPDLS